MDFTDEYHSIQICINKLKCEICQKKIIDKFEFIAKFVTINSIPSVINKIIVVTSNQMCRLIVS